MENRSPSKSVSSQHTPSNTTLLPDESPAQKIVYRFEVLYRHLQSLRLQDDIEGCVREGKALLAEKECPYYFQLKILNLLGSILPLEEAWKCQSAAESLCEFIRGVSDPDLDEWTQQMCDDTARLGEILELYEKKKDDSTLPKQPSTTNPDATITLSTIHRFDDDYRHLQSLWLQNHFESCIREGQALLAQPDCPKYFQIKTLTLLGTCLPRNEGWTCYSAARSLCDYLRDVYPLGEHDELNLMVRRLCNDTERLRLMLEYSDGAASDDIKDKEEEESAAEGPALQRAEKQVGVAPVARMVASKEDEQSKQTNNDTKPPQDNDLATSIKNRASLKRKMNASDCAEEPLFKRADSKAVE